MGGRAQIFLRTGARIDTAN